MTLITNNNKNTSRKLSRDQARKLVRSLLDMAQIINNFRFFNADTISDDEFLQLARKEKKIRDQADELTITLFENIVTDIKDPQDKILQTIDKVNDALRELEEINKILDIASKVINLFSTIALTVSTGNIAQLSTIIKQIEDLL